VREGRDGRSARNGRAEGRRIAADERQSSRDAVVAKLLDDEEKARLAAFDALDTTNS
jgi:hypothetical protein